MTSQANQILLEAVAAQIQQASLLTEQGDLRGSEANTATANVINLQITSSWAKNKVKI